MDQPIAEAPPTSTAATRETEPEVVAGISSGNPSLPLSFRVGGLNVPYGRLAMLLAGGLALGYGLSRWMTRSKT